jgi:AcrR family transcriptional regulator
MRTIRQVSKSVKRRAYRSSVRTAAAARTRVLILKAARELFLKDGYAVTTMSAIANRANVALDTVYAAVGRKTDLFAQLIESAIAGTDAVLDVEQRDYVMAIRSAKTGREKLRIYASAIGKIEPRLAPLYAVLRSAADAERELARLWNGISSRRARNMRLFAEDLRATGELRSDLTIDRVADIIWSMNGPEYYTLLVTERCWNVEVFSAFLYEAWCRLLLRL